MNVSLRLFAIAAAALTPVTAIDAREVSLLDFSTVPDAADTFSQVVETPLSPGGVDLGALASDFQLIGGPRVSYPDIPALARSMVPAWMRPDGPLFNLPAMPLGSPLINQTIAECAGQGYQPRYGLPASTEARRRRMFPLVAQVACEYSIPVALFDGLITQESRYNMFAVSPVGAMGLTQLMPGTARDLRVTNPFDAVQNLRGGARYLQMMLKKFGRYDLALAAYNSGPGRVERLGRVPRIAETMNYVATILGGWQRQAPRFATVLPMEPGATTFQQASAAALSAATPLAIRPRRQVTLASFR